MILKKIEFLECLHVPHYPHPPHPMCPTPPPQGPGPGSGPNHMGWGGWGGNVATKRLSFERLSFEMGLCIAQTQETQGTLAKHTWFLGIA